MKKLILTILIMLLIALPIGSYVYNHYHPICWKYNNKFIKGNNIEAVKQRYGEFDFYYYDNEKDKICCGYSIKQNLKTSEGNLYDIGFVIYVDKENICVSVQKTIVYKEGIK